MDSGERMFILPRFSQCFPDASYTNDIFIEEAFGNEVGRIGFEHIKTDALGKFEIGGICLHSIMSASQMFHFL